MSNDPRKPAVLELDPPDLAGESPNTAPPPPDIEAPLPGAEGRAMQLAARFAARRASPLAAFFWTGLLGLLGLALTTWAYGFVTGLMASAPLLGWLAVGLVGLLLVACLGYGLSELLALSRLRKVDRIQRDAGAALAAGDTARAQAVLAALGRLYQGRADMVWARDELARRSDGVMDADALLDLAERTMMAPLDVAARTEIETATRHVAAATALVPLALADVVVALSANIAMIRRVAQVYGGRAGTVGSWRLMRAVATHLVATGAVAVGDDLIGSMAGGGLVSKVSRRFGEGVVNGALTARVGIAAMEVCRPLPHRALPAPTTSGLISSALGGLFARAKGG